MSRFPPSKISELVVLEFPVIWFKATIIKLQEDHNNADVHRNLIYGSKNWNNINVQTWGESIVYLLDVI